MKRKTDYLFLTFCIMFNLGCLAVILFGQPVEYPASGGILHFNPITGTVFDYESPEIPELAEGQSFDINVIIPEEIRGVKVKAIGDKAFLGCWYLGTLTIPESVKSIGEDVFAFTNLEHLRNTLFYGGSPGQIDNNSGNNIDYFNVTVYPINDGNLVFDPQTGTILACDNATNVDIPEEINGVPVVAIGFCAFRGCNNLTSITIPDSVTTIEEGGLYLPYNYNRPVFYYGGTRAQWAHHGMSENNSRYSVDFYYSESETRHLIPGGVLYFDPEIGAVTGFAGTGTEISIPNEIDGVPVVAIECLAFSEHNNLTSITIPDSVMTIDSSAFSYCNLWKGIWVDENNPKYCNDENGILFNKDKTELIAYRDTSVEYTIPESVTSIGDYAFYDCDSLTSITIPEGVTAIGDYAFSNCYNLASITIPEGVTSIGDHAFSGCNSLTNITIPEGVTTICDYAFYQCYDLTNITIPEGVTAIGDHAFSGSYFLTSITIPDSVTTIGDYAFFGCDMTNITIANSVTTIGDSAFADCFQLNDIYFVGSEEQWAQIDKGNNGFIDVVIHFNAEA